MANSLALECKYHLLWDNEDRLLHFGSNVRAAVVYTELHVQTEGKHFRERGAAACKQQARPGRTYTLSPLLTRQKSDGPFQPSAAVRALITGPTCLLGG